jgi:hypothetical protein
MIAIFKKYTHLTIIFFLSLSLASCGWFEDKNYEATIRVTSYGIPHIMAENWGDLGFGYGYQFASDNLCTFAKHVVRVNGGMAKYFGRTNEHLANDALLGFFGRESIIRSNLMKEWQMFQKVMRLATIIILKTFLQVDMNLVLMPSG